MVKYLLLLFFAASIALQAQTVTDLTSKTGTTEDLYAVYFINATTGWAAGANKTIIKTTDGGETWISQTSSNFIAGTIRSLYFVNSTVGYAVNNKTADPNYPGVFKTSDGGASWTSVVDISGGAATGGMYFSSEDHGVVTNPTNIFVNNGIGVWNSANVPCTDVWFTDANNGFVCGATSIYVTANGGANWNTKSPGSILGCEFKSVYPISTSTIMCVGVHTYSSQKFYKTIDGGATWNTITNPTVQACWKVRFGNLTTGYAVGNSGAIARTIDAGDSWTSVSSGKSTTLYSVSCPQNTGVAYVAGASGVLLKITDSALPVELISLTVSTATNGVTLHWKTATETNNYGFDVEKSKEKSDVWEKVGFVEGHGTTNAAQSYIYSDNTATGNVAYRLKQIDRDGKFEYSKEVDATVSAPAIFALSQNYPNPFNPATVINYSIASAAHVSLKVYDLLGREMAVLVNQQMSPGNYTATFDGSRLSSGVYFYRVDAGSFTDVKRLTIMK